MGHFRVQVAPNGRMVLPSALRQQLDLADGGQLILRDDDGQVVLESVAAAVRRAQALVRRHCSGSGSVTDELLAERRAEASEA